MLKTRRRLFMIAAVTTMTFCALEWFSFSTDSKAQSREYIQHLEMLKKPFDSELQYHHKEEHETLLQEPAGLRTPTVTKDESEKPIPLSNVSYRSPGPLKKGFMELHKLGDDYSYCPRVSPFLGPFNYTEKAKNPCWWANGTFQCVPFFYIVGFSKCGTTDLFHRIRMHPEVLQPQRKESHWFDYIRFFDRLRFIQNYTNSFLEASDKIKQAITAVGYSRKVTVDATPCYAWGSLIWRCYEGNQGLEEPLYTNADVIHRLYPKAKIIISVREPVERLYSRIKSWIPYPHADVYVHPSPEGFEELIVNAVNKYKECFKRWSVRQCAYNGTLYSEVRVRLQEGMYSVFLKDWMKVFPKEQLFISRFEDYVKDKLTVLQDVFSFLTLTPPGKGTVDKLNFGGVVNPAQAKNYVNFTRRTTEVLEDFYRPFVMELAQIMGDDRFAWHYK